MLPKKLQTWLARIRKFAFTYSNGFFHLPYNRSNPDKLIDSFKGLPFVKHSPAQQCVSTATPLMEGGFHYRQLQDGCWIIYSRMRYKANVAFDLILDEQDESDYYMLSLNNVSNDVRAYTSEYDGHVCFPKYSWTFVKPMVYDCSVNFKGDDSRFITLFFNEAWLRANLATSSLFQDNGLSRFLEADDMHHLLWPLETSDIDPTVFAQFERLISGDDGTRPVDMLLLQSRVLNLIFDFLAFCKTRDMLDGCIFNDHLEQSKLMRLENYLINNLLTKFPGIEYLAEKFDISPTRLKAEFKQLYGKPVYQYFQAKQMVLARTMLEEKEMRIKEVAHLLGYASPGKFSAVFSKHHGLLPSELGKQGVVG